jgi:hypothetical protein
MSTRLPLVLAATTVSALALLAGCGDPEAPADTDETPSAAGSPDGGSPTGTTAATPSSTATEDPAPTETPGGEVTALTTKGLPQGEAPGIAVLVAGDPASPAGTWTLRRSSGATVDLSVQRPFGFVPLGEAMVVMEDDGDGAAALYVDGTGGEVTREDVLGYRLAVSANGAMVAWLAPDHRVHFMEQGREGVFDLPEVPGAVEMGALSGYDTCFEAESDVGGCTAFVDVDEPRQAWLTSSHGIVDTAGPLLSVADTYEGRLVGLLSVTDEGSCGGLFKRLTTAVWQTCDHTLQSFSPDGRLVLGTDAYLDGFGRRTVAFLDAPSGDLRREFRSNGHGPTVLQTAWEDADHVLAVVFERGRWSVVRLGSDGSAEVALGPVDGVDLERPYVLAEN